MSNNPEAGSTPPAAGSQPNATPSEPATGTNAGGDKQPTTYDPKSFGAGVTKAKAEAQAKIDDLAAKLAEYEKRHKDAEISGASADELRKALADRDSKLESLTKQADSLKGHVKTQLVKRLETLPENVRPSIKDAIDNGDLGTADTMLALAESLIGKAAPVKTSAHAPVGPEGQGFDWATHDRLHAESWKDGGRRYGEWIAKNPMPKR